MRFDRPVIDSHWHLYTWEDRQGQDFRAAIAHIKEALGLSAVNICSIPIYNGLGPAQNLLAALYKLSDPSAYAYGGLVYPEKPLRIPMPAGTDPLSQLRELREIGFDGIKMLELKPTEQKAYGILLDDPYYEPFFEACEREEIPLILHAADPETFWDLDRIPKRFLDRGWFYGDGTYLPYERIYEQLYAILERHPRLRVTFAHFFFLSGRPEKLEELFSRFPNVCVDITPGAEMYADFRERREFYRDFFTKWSGRILLGTDSALRDTGDVDTGRIGSVYRFLTTDEPVHIIAEDCRGLALDAEAADGILRGNFLRMAGARPRPADREALRRYLEKYRHLITDEKLLWHIEEELGRREEG